MMKKLKQKFALLTACMMLAGSMTSANISAEDRLLLIRTDGGEMMLVMEDADETIVKTEWKDGLETITRGEHGEAIYHQTTRQETYIITTADGMPTDCGCTGTEMNLNALSFAEGFEDWFSQYPEGSRLFRIGKNKADKAKKLCFDYDTVIDAVYFWKEYSCNAYWDGTVSFSPTNPTTEEDLLGWYMIEDDELIYINKDGEKTNPPKDLGNESYERLKEYLLSRPGYKQPIFENHISKEGFTALDNIYQIGKEWYTKYTDWYASLEAPETMSPAELEASRKSAGIEGEYDMIQKVYDLSQDLVTYYGDDFESVYPGFEYHSSYDPEGSHSAWDVFSFRPVSIWNIVGDTDKDGIINVCDAAEILRYITATSTGAKYQDNTDREYKEAIYDLNADQKINAIDAALLLEYIAQVGSGQADNLKEFIKQKAGA